MAGTPVERRANVGVGTVGLLLAVAVVASVVWVASAHAAALPDGRVYEQVSPVVKDGGDVLLDTSRVRAAGDGDALGFASLQQFGGDVQGTAISVDYIATRGYGGWSTHAITPQQEPLSGLLLFTGAGDAIFEGEYSSDLQHGVVNANAFPSGNPNVATVQNLFVRNDLLTAGAGLFNLVSNSVAPIPQVDPGGFRSTYRPYFVGASADFGHVIFESSLNLTQQAIDAGLPDGPSDFKLYEWDHGTVRLVGILPASEGGGVATAAVAGHDAPGISPQFPLDTISADGSRIFFTVPDAPGSLSGQLYMRVDGSSTVRINASESTVPDVVHGSATFWAASRDGSKVFFTSAEQLTNDATSAGQSTLYRYDANAPTGAHLQRIAVARGVIGVSDNGDWAYFIARGQLVPGAPIPSDPGSRLIFAWHTGAPLAYVGKLRTDLVDEIQALGTNGWVLGEKTSRVSPDGTHLFFMTYEGDQVPPHDHGECGQNVEPDNLVGKCREAYVYDALGNGGAGELVCVSCAPNGDPGTADAGVNFRVGTAGSRNTWHLNHPLSADGHFAFFSTKQPLLPEDHNAVQDVYEYDLQAKQLHLISSGAAGASNSYFMDASADGRDVFFATRDQLVGWDTDTSYDVYDARIGGGFPGPMPGPLPCAGEACQGPGTLPPALQSAASSTFHGAGNVTPQAAKKPPVRKKCGRGKVRRRVGGRVRCVKKRAHAVSRRHVHAGRPGARARAVVGRHGKGRGR